MAGIRKEGVEDARKNLPTLLERARQGKSTVITKRGVPYAAIVPVSEVARKRAGLTIRDLRGSGKNLWSEDVAVWVDKLRREWE